MNQLILNIISVFKSAGVNQAQKAITGLGGGLSKFAAQAGAAAGAFAAFNALTNINDFAQNAIDQAQQLERNMAAVTQVFESEAPKMNRYIAGIENYGLAQAEAAKATVFIGSVLKQSGFEIEQTSRLTQDLTKLAVDLSTTFGYDVQEALLGMTALFRGEYDPIEKFGVAMKQSEINAELAARGLDKLEGAQRRLAEQQIRVQFLFERGADAIGAFERLQGSLYVSTKQLEAAFTNLQAEAGAPLQDALAAINDALTAVIDENGDRIVQVFELIGEKMQAVAPLAEDLATIFFELTGIVGGFIDVVAELGILFTPWATNIHMAAEGLESLGIMFELASNQFQVFREEFEFILNQRLPALGALMSGINDIFDGFNNTLDENQQKVRDLTLQYQISNGIIDEATLTSLEFAEVNRANVALALAQAEAALRRTTNAARGYTESYMALVAMGAATNPFATWSVPKFTGGGGGGSAAKAADPIKDFFNKLKEEIAKQKALLKLESMGASESVIETILGASDWQAVYKKIRDGGKKALDEVAAMLKRGYDYAMQQREKLKALKENVKDAVSGIADNLLGAFNLKDFGRTTGEIVSNMRKMVERIRAFKDEVTRVAKAGLNPQLLQQVLAMGPTEGLSFARALLAGGNIGELNALYGQATSLALEAGRGVVTAQQNYYITVNGGVGDKKTIGAAIVEAIKAYERTSGVGWRA